MRVENERFHALQSAPRVHGRCAPAPYRGSASLRAERIPPWPERIGRIRSHCWTRAFDAIVFSELPRTSGELWKRRLIDLDSASFRLIQVQRPRAALGEYRPPCVLSKRGGFTATSHRMEPFSLMLGATCLFRSPPRRLSRKFTILNG